MDVFHKEFEEPILNSIRLGTSTVVLNVEPKFRHAENVMGIITVPAPGAATRVCDTEFRELI